MRRRGLTKDVLTTYSSVACFTHNAAISRVLKGIGSLYMLKRSEKLTSIGRVLGVQTGNAATRASCEADRPLDDSCRMIGRSGAATLVISMFLLYACSAKIESGQEMTLPGSSCAFFSDK